MKPIPRIYLIRIKYILLLLLCALGLILHAPQLWSGKNKSSEAGAPSTSPKRHP